MGNTAQFFKGRLLSSLALELSAVFRSPRSLQPYFFPLTFLSTTLSSPCLWSCHFLKSSSPSVHKSLSHSFFKTSSSLASLMDLWCQSSLTSSTLSSLTRSICSYFSINFRRWTIPWWRDSFFFLIFVTLHPTVPGIEATLKSDNKYILLISNWFTCALLLLFGYVLN